jgi:hypothetical protein
MAIGDISGLASSASLTFNQGAPRVGQQELESTGEENTPPTTVTAAGGSDESGFGGGDQRSALSSGSEGRGSLIDITV